VPASQRQTRQALAFSGQWLMLLLVVWTVALSGVLRTLFRWLWPEQVALLGVLGWQVAGPTVVVLLLVGLGVLGRLHSAGWGLRRLLLAGRPVPAGSSLRRG
jgi:hypothetical protein